jgi:hypothetical protein
MLVKDPTNLTLFAISQVPCVCIKAHATVKVCVSTKTRHSQLQLQLQLADFPHHQGPHFQFREAYIWITIVKT